MKPLDFKKRIIEKNGKFFKYINTTDINLERYQILTKESNTDIVKENCLLHTLRLAEVEEHKIKTVSTTIKEGSYIAKKQLKLISTIIERSINLYTISNCTTTRKYDKQTINSKLGNCINIALYQNHYFIFESTEYTKYSIKNYADVKDENDYKNISEKENNCYKRKSKAGRIDNLEMIHILFNAGYFVEDPIYLSKI